MAIENALKDHTIAQSNADTPGWDDLLVSLDHRAPALPAEAYRRKILAAENIIESLLNGMAVTGDMQWKASVHPDWPIDSVTVHTLGVLQLNLSELVAGLRVIERNARDAWHAIELADARGELA
jgi:hypothetical protein